MKANLIAISILAFSVCGTGCSFFTNRAKREVLVSADKELDGLIADHQKGCLDFSQRLSGLKERVRKELEKLK